MLGETPQCVYEEAGDHSLHSSGPVHVQAADGKFSITGEGFLWRQTNSAVLISNRVHTVIHPELLQGQPPLGDAKKTAGNTKGIEIFSDQLDYSGETGLGHYRGNVRVTGDDFEMTAGRLQFLLPVKLRQLQRLTVEENVVVHSGDLRAQGQQVAYSPDTGLIRVTGEPSWQMTEREGRGDELEIDRTNQIFRAVGHAWLKISGLSSGASGFLPNPALATASSVPATNQTVEIEAESYEIRTNLAAFRNQVRVTQRVGEQPQGQLTCGRMTATFAGTNQMERLVAEEAVVFQQDAKRFSADRATYTGTNGILELNGNPVWQDGPRQGKGDVVLIDARRSELIARGHASVRLPAQEISSTALMPAASEKVGDSQPAAASAHPAVATNQFAEITALEYRLQTNSALFLGQVRVTHPQMNLACESVAVDFPRGGGTAERIVAERSVEFDLKDDKGQQIHGTSQKANYTYQVTTAGTNDLIELTGNPVLTMTNGSTFQNSVLILDRASGKLVAPGKYLIRGIGTTDVAAASVPWWPKTKRK
jgi:lipopolysaccharide export system protein LptA